MPSNRVQYLISCLLLLGFAVLVAVIFISKPSPVVQEFEPRPSYVTTETITLREHTIELKSLAYLQAKHQRQLVSQLNGSVVQLSESFAAGKAFKKGQLLLTIDSTQADLDLQQALLQLKQAKLKLQELQAHQQAQNNEANDSLSDLAQGKPQLALAKQQVTTAQAAVKLAKQQLQASAIKAPFNGKVLTTAVQQGDLVRVGSPLGAIYSYQHYQARIPISQAWLKFINLPDSGEAASQVTAYDPISETSLLGSLVGSEGQLAANGLIYLLADFDALEDNLQQRLLLQSPLEISIRSKVLSDVAVIPTTALRSNNRVWLLSPEQSLQFRTVTVLYRDDKQVYIEQGLQEGDQLITSSLATAIEGMALTTDSHHE